MFICSPTIFAASDEKIISNQTVTHEYETLDLTSIKKVNLNKDSKVTDFISHEDWENLLQKKYKEKYPDYNGEITINDVTMEQYLKTNISVGSSKDIDNKGNHSIIPYSLYSAPSTGFPNGSVGKTIFVYYHSDGTIDQLSASAFKVNGTTVGTAGHAVYSHDLNGWADTASIFFGLKDTPVGWEFNAAYTATGVRTNNDWVNTGNFRSDFGALDIRLDVGTAPSNLSLYKNPPSTANNVKNFGYPGWVDQKAFNTSSGNIVTGPLAYLHQTYEAHNNSVVSAFGMSGGPLLNTNNQVIGINSYRSDSGYGPTSGFMKMTTEAYNLIMQ